MELRIELKYVGANNDAKGESTPVATDNHIRDEALVGRMVMRLRMGAFFNYSQCLIALAFDPRRNHLDLSVQTRLPRRCVSLTEII
jgi:hypothetical protein